MVIRVAVNKDFKFQGSPARDLVIFNDSSDSVQHSLEASHSIPRQDL